MSYSVCLRCEKAVRQYEKYCDECAREYRQDENFWKTHGYDYLEQPKKLQELLADKAIPWKPRKATE